MLQEGFALTGRNGGVRAVAQCPISNRQQAEAVPQLRGSDFHTFVEGMLKRQLPNDQGESAWI
jgi:hypothetical protein